MKKAKTKPKITRTEHSVIEFVRNAINSFDDFENMVTEIYRVSRYEYLVLMKHNIILFLDKKNKTYEFGPNEDMQSKEFIEELLSSGGKKIFDVIEDAKTWQVA